MNYIFQFSQLQPYAWTLLEGVKLTIVLSIEAMALSLLVGIVGAACKSSSFRLLRWIASSYVEIIRNTPILVQLFIIYFSLPSLGLRFSPGSAALIALVINGGAYLTEIIRGGINSVSKGQIEAGYALGLSRADVFFRVILLPAIRASYPAIASEFRLLMLNTSICSIVAAQELTSVGNSINALTLRSFEIYTVILLIYLALSIGFSLVFKIISKIFLSWKL